MLPELIQGRGVQDVGPYKARAVHTFPNPTFVASLDDTPQAAMMERRYMRRYLVGRTVNGVGLVLCAYFPEEWDDEARVAWAMQQPVSAWHLHSLPQNYAPYQG